MTQETIQDLLQELGEIYEGVTTARDEGVTLVCLPRVQFPSGCDPAWTSALVALDPAKPKPDLYLKTIPTIRGAQVQHGAALVGAENWLTFSYTLNWVEHEHSAVQFVAGMLRRFV